MFFLWLFKFNVHLEWIKQLSFFLFWFLWKLENSFVVYIALLKNVFQMIFSHSVIYFFFGGFCVCVWCFPFSDFADFFVAMKYPSGLPKNWLHYQISLIRQTRRDGEKNILWWLWFPAQLGLNMLNSSNDMNCS